MTLSKLEPGAQSGASAPRVNIVFDGDSMTVGSGGQGALNYPAYAAAGLDPRSVITNKGVGGQTLLLMESDAATDIDSLKSATLPNLLVALGGTNDLFFGADAATTYNRLVTYCTNRRAAGWKVVVFTILPRSDSAPGSFEADRQTVNTSIRNGWATFADALADIASDTRIGDSGDETGPYYSGDNVHPSSRGYQVIAEWAQKAIIPLGYAGMHQHHGLYMPSPGVLWLPAGEAAVSDPAVVVEANAGAGPVKVLPDAVVSYMTWSRRLPPDWVSFNMDVWWTKSGGTGSAVYLRGDWHLAQPGTNLATGSSLGGAVAENVPSTSIVKETRLRNSVAVDSSKLMSLRVFRDGTHATDTFTSSALILGVALSRQGL